MEEEEPVAMEELVVCLVLVEMEELEEMVQKEEWVAQVLEPRAEPVEQEEMVQKEEPVVCLVLVETEELEESAD